MLFELIASLPLGIVAANSFNRTGDDGLNSSG